MKKIFLLIFILVSINLLGQNSSIGTTQRFFKKELLLKQSLKLEIEQLLIKSKASLDSGKFIEANNYLIQAVTKLPALGLSKKNIIQKQIELKDYQSKLYLKWAEVLISKNDIKLIDLSLAVENLQKAQSLSSLYDKKIDALRLKVINKKEKLSKEKSIRIKEIIGLDKVLDSGNKGVARRKHLVSIRLERGRVYFNSRDYGNAINEFESVLVLNPYHSQAKQYLKKCYNKLKLYGERREEMTISQLLASIGWGWSNEIKVSDKLKQSKKIERAVAKSSSVEKTKKKLNVVIDNFTLNNSRVEDALERLRVLSKQKDPDGVGFNFIIKDLEEEEEKERRRRRRKSF